MTFTLIINYLNVDLEMNSDLDIVLATIVLKSKICILIKRF